MSIDPIARKAVKDSAPIFLPAIPFALVLGVAITESVMPTWVGFSTNPLVFAGAAQLATVTLAGTASWLTLVLTAAVINLRHVMYSAALSPRFANQPTWFRWVGPHVLIDQVFAITSAEDELSDDDWRRYYLVTGGFFIMGWHIAVAAGLIVGSSIPEAWRLNVAPSIMFAGLVVLGLTNKPGIIAALTGAVVCFGALDLPNNGGILVGAAAGVVAGYLADVAFDKQAMNKQALEAPSVEAP